MFDMCSILFTNTYISLYNRTNGIIRSETYMN